MSTLAPHLEQILTDLRPAAERLAGARRRRRRVTRVAATGLAVAGLGGTAAVAGLQLGDAPESVKRDFSAVDAGMPADLRLNPDVEHAHRVAVADGAAVYFAPLAGGGYCAELVTGDRPRGAVCSTPEQTDRTPIGVTIPFTDPVTERSPVTVSGHVSVADAQSLRLVYPDGGSDTVTLSASRFYVATVPPGHLRAVHRGGLMLLALDGAGESLAQAVVPADAITPNEDAHHDPIEMDMLSDASDFTLLLGVRGRVYAHGAASMRLVYPGGDAITEPVRDDGRYRIDIPAARRHDFARRAGTLQALSADGRVVAERPIASVAWWRATRR